MSDGDGKLVQLPVVHRDVGARLIEMIRQTPGIKAGVFIAIDGDLRGTRVFLHADDATEAHLSLILGDMTVVQHRIASALDSADSVSEIVGGGEPVS